MPVRKPTTTDRPRPAPAPTTLGPLPPRTRHFHEMLAPKPGTPAPTVRERIRARFTQITRPAASIDRLRVPEGGTHAQQLKDRQAQMAGAQRAAQDYATKIRQRSERTQRARNRHLPQLERSR